MTHADRLYDLAYNLRWDWHVPTRALFRELDPELWEQVDHNPVALLRRLDPDRLTAAGEDRVTRLWEEMEAYRTAGDVWYDGDRDPDRPLVAYFSAEFGITEALRIYSGGLGVLAGDHLKSASDLGVPLVAVGMLYREGYFKQSLDPTGRQTETFPVADFDDLPVRPVTRPDGTELRVLVPFPGRQVSARVWRADVGRVRLFLLDTDVRENTDADRRLTSRLYGGDQETRIAQEILLGMGGYRALEAMGIRPETYHMNEGHSAFLALDLVREIMQREELPFEAAAERARQCCVFTTHTPVPAGHDRFPRELMARYMTETAHALGLELDELMELGREEEGRGPFTMTVLAIRLSRATNGVSALHGQVSRRMWQGLWPDRVVADVPIDHITNGIHVPTWIHDDIVGTWGVSPEQVGVEDAAVPDPDPAELWRVHEARRHDLVDYVRARTGAELDPGALTVAFARRFATYKRATLLLDDLERLDRVLNHPDRPVQMLFAGKAHPRDEGGKALIARISAVSRDERFRNRIVFVPGYGIDVARQLVQGADVWLNNPRRPMEASGTSGMKAAMNGVLNLSVLDGWWDEAFRSRDADAPAPGWGIGAGADAGAPEAADAADADALLRALEGEVAPKFYDRDAEGLPQEWLAMMRESIRQVSPFFNTHRMLRDYVQRYRVGETIAG